MSELKKKYRSLLSIPIKVEMAPVEHQSSRVLTVDELSQQIDEARKGKAKVDSKYVGFSSDDAGHLFDYKFNYVRYLENMSHIIREARARPKVDRYKNPHKMLIK